VSILDDIPTSYLDCMRIVCSRNDVLSVSILDDIPTSYLDCMCIVCSRNDVLSVSISPSENTYLFVFVCVLFLNLFTVHETHTGNTRTLYVLFLFNFPFLGYSFINEHFSSSENVVI